jgi:hypothetical protein
MCVAIGHQGTDFFTYHMAVGGLHTNPVTVAITVTTREEAERLGSALSQQQTGGMIFGRMSQHGEQERASEAGDGSRYASASQHDGSYDEEAAESPAPAPTPRERPAPPSGTSSPAQFNRKASYRDGVMPPGPAQAASASTPAASAAGSTSAGGGPSGGTRGSVVTPTRTSTVEMGSTNRSVESSPPSMDLRRAASAGREDPRRALMTSDRSAATKKSETGRSESTSPAAEMSLKGATKRK